MSLTGRGRPRWVAAADRPPQVTAMVRLPGMTGLPDSQSSSIARLRGPQRRRLAHWVISPMVTNVRIGCRPTSRVASPEGSRPRNDREATSVSRTTALAAGSGNVRAPRLGHEREKLIELFIALERVVAQLVDRGDRVSARRLLNQLR